MTSDDAQAHWSPNQYRPIREYTYKFTPNGELRAHVFFPFDWRPSDRRAGIVFFFGGGWTDGSPAQFFRHSIYFASRGLVCACADYRVKNRHNVTPDVCVEDAVSAVRWLRGHAAALGIDPGRIVASGGSAGAHLAACTAMAEGFDTPGEDASVSASPQALVLFNPALAFDAERSNKRSIDEATGRRISPIDLLSAGAPPTVLFYGTEDKVCPHGQAYADKAKSLGAAVELNLYEGAAHGFFNHDPWFKRTLHRADEFLASLGYLSGPPSFSLQPGGE